MNVAQLINNGIGPDEAGSISASWNAAYEGIREELTARVRTAKALGGDATRVKEIRRELGQLDRCAHRACTQSPPGFSAYAALRLIQESLLYLPLELQGDVHRLAALLADWARVERARTERAARLTEVYRRG
ncbi:hypothetical protein ADK56_31025 [Streptomyces sp. MMG1522]|uniref:hypothetical protein n=1 Tax=Streptomyces sp. MMG1522 TaxID=1415545 RepID=UPI0006ADE75E|nr:hypothetical protein [Streptomyces sp. MMG1522]KOU46172.1 hypothetical protein ADK56_31025 [Streptomyces sp. MMG1522]